MADQLAPVALHGLRMAGEHFDDIDNGRKKAMARARRMRTKDKNGETEEYYYSSNRQTRAKSAGDNNYDRDSRGRSSNRRRDDDYYYDSYDSEASIPPISRKRGGSSQGGSSNANGTPKNGGTVVSTRGGGRSSRSSSSSSSSSEDLGSSTDDEKKEKKIRRGELITGGLAAVASIHAAGTVWGSMEARDSREEAVAAGELTKEEAKRERRKNQFQDVAALGLAALAIKGAYGKWKGAAAQEKERKEHKKAHQERHRKRVEKGLDRESRRNGKSISGAPRKQITDGGNSRPSYNRGYSHSENDLSGGGYGGRGYDRDRDYDDYYDRGYDRDRDYYDRGYDRRGGSRDYQGYSRDV